MLNWELYFLAGMIQSADLSKLQFDLLLSQS